jgi:hypothetical protein
MIVHNLIEQIKKSNDITVSKLAVKEKKDIELQILYNDGLFKITPQLISFISVWPKDTVYIEDCCEKPIIINKQEFLEIIVSTYDNAMNKFHEEYNKIINEI